MKKLILSGVLAVGTFMAAQAQSIKFGVKAGLNIATMTNTESSKPRTSLHAGGFVNIGLGKSAWAIQPELLYSGEGVKSDTKPAETIALSYINVPVMVQYSIVPSFYVEAGPQLGILAGAKLKFDGNSEDVKDQMRTANFGLGFGCGYKLDNGLGFSGRYMFGMNDAFKGDYETKNKNAVAQVSVFYQF